MLCVCCVCVRTSVLCMWAEVRDNLFSFYTSGSMRRSASTSRTTYRRSRPLQPAWGCYVVSSMPYECTNARSSLHLPPSSIYLLAGLLGGACQCACQCQWAMWSIGQRACPTPGRAGAAASAGSCQGMVQGMGDGCRPAGRPGGQKKGVSQSVSRAVGRVSGSRLVNGWINNGVMS